MQIYLDYSATTPTRPEAIAAMTEVMTRQWGNPSSLHAWGQRATLAVEQARMQVAQLIHATPEALVFTGGGTESDNLAILGVCLAHRSGLYSPLGHLPGHVILSSVEHSAVSQPVQWLESQGWRVTRLPVDREGRVNPETLRRAIAPDTVLVSVIYGQSEVGTLQPIAELGEITRAAGVLFHTDAVQAAGRVPIDVRHLPVDLLSLSSHKLYGPQGVGALYVRPGVELQPQALGGGQEMGLRSGTQAVAAIAGFGVAAELAAQELGEEAARLTRLRDHLFAQLADIAELRPTGHRQQRLPHHVSFCLEGCLANCAAPITGRSLVRELNLAGIGISSGSACNSGKTIPSPTLLAMGYSDTVALSAIRLTLGRQTTEADVDWTALVLRQVLERLCPQRSRGLAFR